MRALPSLFFRSVHTSLAPLCHACLKIVESEAVRKWQSHPGMQAWQQDARDLRICRFPGSFCDSSWMCFRSLVQKLNSSLRVQIVHFLHLLADAVLGLELRESFLGMLYTWHFDHVICPRPRYKCVRMFTKMFSYKAVDQSLPTDHDLACVRCFV